jgi:acetyl esterase/lipase
MKKIIFSLCLLPIFACKQQVDTSKAQNKWMDIAYAQSSDAQKMDIFLPENAKDKNPLVVFVHGGAFLFGDKADKQVTPALELLKHGYALVSINYRLSGEAHFPAQIQDVKAAIRFLRANAAKYKLATDKIAIWGGSAGGYLSALAGVSGDVAALDDPNLGNAEQSSRVQAVIDWFGPINFLTMDANLRESGKGKPDHDGAESPESRLWGKPIQEIPDLVKTANPETYLSSDDAVFFLQHGSEDKLVPTQQSGHFAEMLTAILGKEKVIYEILQGANHGDPAFETPENMAKVLIFLDKNIK